MVANGQMVDFVRFKHGALIYVTECGFEFPVPASDISGEAEVLDKERAMSMMKWIRKHLEFIQSAKTS